MEKRDANSRVHIFLIVDVCSDPAVDRISISTIPRGDHSQMVSQATTRREAKDAFLSAAAAVENRPQRQANSHELSVTIIAGHFYHNRSLSNRTNIYLHISVKYMNPMFDESKYCGFKKLNLYIPKFK